MNKLQTLFIQELRDRYGLEPGDVGNIEDFVFETEDDVEEELLHLEYKYGLINVRKKFYQ